MRPGRGFVPYEYMVREMYKRSGYLNNLTRQSTYIRRHQGTDAYSSLLHRIMLICKPKVYKYVYITRAIGVKYGAKICFVSQTHLTKHHLTAVSAIIISGIFSQLPDSILPTFYDLILPTFYDSFRASIPLFTRYDFIFDSSHDSWLPFKWITRESHIC